MDAENHIDFVIVGNVQAAKIDKKRLIGLIYLRV